MSENLKIQKSFKTVISMLRNVNFESELRQLGYTLKEFHLIGIPAEGYCSLSIPTKNHGCTANHTDVLYFQHCSCGYCLSCVSNARISKDLPWYRYSGCKYCVNAESGVLYCGCHYAAMRHYSISSKNRLKLRDTTNDDLNPHAEIFGSEDEY